MKKHDFKTLALMGLTGGLLLGQQGAVNASGTDFQETPWESLKEHKCGGEHGCSGVLADHSCKGQGGCGGLNANGCKGKGGCGGLNANGCKGKGGCGGLVADRDNTDSPDQDYESPESAKNSGKDQQKNDPNQGNMRYHLMTEQELLIELNSDGTRMYNSLDDQGKMLARKVASMMCQGTNECKGLNGCMTDKNTCAGKGACKGQGKCAISDKNLAVKLVYDKMAGKRANMLK